MRPEESLAAIESHLPAIVEEFGRVGDQHGLAKAQFAWVQVHAIRNKMGAWAKHAMQAAKHADLAGEEGLRVESLGWYLSALVHGLTPAEVVRTATRLKPARSSRSRRGTLMPPSVCARNAHDWAYAGEHYMSRGNANQQLSHVLAARGRTGDAREAARAARDVYQRKGDRPAMAAAEAQLQATA